MVGDNGCWFAGFIAQSNYPEREFFYAIRKFLYIDGGRARPWKKLSM
jgi:hypothetical protein